MSAKKRPVFFKTLGENPKKLIKNRSNRAGQRKSRIKYEKIPILAKGG
jgi:hypothetical protein